MSEASKDNQLAGKVPSSIEDGLAALEGQNLELLKKNESLESRIHILEVRLATTEDTLINLSPQTLGKQGHKAFALFPKLPPELRRMIWVSLRPSPRVLKIFEKRVEEEGRLYLDLYATAKVPTLLHVCQESRQIAKEWYKLSFTPSFGYSKIPRIYFDFSSDFVYFPFPSGQDKNHPTRSTCHPSAISHEDRYKVKKVVQEVARVLDRFYEMARGYPSATETMLIVDEEGMSQGSAEQSDFKNVAGDFRWQEGRTLYQFYHDVSQRPGEVYKDLSWNLKSIQRVKFSGVERDG